MKLDRLLGITMALMTKKRVTAAELATRFEVSIRTIYRDVELINQAGIPVASFTGADGGFELMDGFFLTKQFFSIDDFSVIYHVLMNMDGALGGQLTTLTNKVGSLHPALLKGGINPKILFDLSCAEREKAVISPLFQAVHQTRVVEFSYTNGSGEVSERQVEPSQLCWAYGVWYLEGYCLLRRSKRTFRISRISQLQVSEQTFQPRKELPNSSPTANQGMKVHLRFDLHAQPRALEQFQDEYIHQGTHIDVHTVFYSKEYALSIILSFGSKVEIISPDSLRQDLIKLTDEIRGIYCNRPKEDET